MATTLDPGEVLRSTSGKANFQRVARLLISGGTALLREIFDLICPPSNLPTILQNPATKKQLKKAKILKPEWDCLYPSPGVYGKSEDFDVTLLFRLLRTICNLIPPATGWDALPTSTDHSLAADLARIKYYRNSVYGHANQNMEITDEEFPQLWQEIRDALVGIAGQVSSAKKTEWQEAIDNFLQDPLTAEDERNIVELLCWYRNDTEVKESIEELKVTTHEGMKRLEAQQKNTTQEIQEGLARLETSLKGVDATQDQEDIKEMKVMLHQLLSLVGEGFQSPEGHLTRNRTTGSSSQVGASEVMGLRAFEDAVGNSRIVYESEVGVNKITLKYEQVKVLQDELGEQILRLWDIIKRVVASNNELATKSNEYRSRLLSSLKRGLFWITFGLLSFVGYISGLFTVVVGSVLSMFSNVFCLLSVGEDTKFRFSAKEREEMSKRMQLLNELQQKDGQFKEALHVTKTKLASFTQHLHEIAESCEEHPNEMVVLRECGPVSTQQVLRDIRTFRSRLEDFLSSAYNSRETHGEVILDLDEEAMSSNQEVGVTEADSALSEDEKVMKFKGLITAPIILTAGSMQ